MLRKRIIQPRYIYCKKDALRYTPPPPPPPLPRGQIREISSPLPHTPVAIESLFVLREHAPNKCNNLVVFVCSLVSYPVSFLRRGPPFIALALHAFVKSNPVRGQGRCWARLRLEAAPEQHVRAQRPQVVRGSRRGSVRHAR